MLVKDIELLKDITVLYEKRIIIYGAGKYGRLALDYLQNIHGKGEAKGIIGFCESDSTLWKNRIGTDSIKGFKVYSIEETRKYLDEGDCIVILAATQENVQQILEDNLLQYDCYYTYAALQWAIELNIQDERVDADFRNDFLKGKAIFMKKFWQRYLWGRLDEVLKINPILIYTPGKVGSLSVFYSIKKHCATIHTHEICGDNDSRIVNLEENRQAIAYYKSVMDRMGTIKIISLVRDPVARQISRYFQPLTLKEPYIPGEHIINDTYLGIHNFLQKSIQIGKSGDEFEWFNEQIKRVFDLDVFAYDFDKEKGYNIIKQKNIECLVMTMEKLNDNINVIGEFVGIPNLKMVKTNVGDDKEYSYIYSEVKKNLHVSKEILDFYYTDNPGTDHFYTEAQKKQFFNKWT